MDPWPSAQSTPSAYRPTRCTSLGTPGSGWPMILRPLVFFTRRPRRRTRQTHPGQDVVHREILVLAPRARAPPDRVLAERPSATVVVNERLADREIAGRADVAAPEAAGEKPVGGPATEAAQRR